MWQDINVIKSTNNSVTIGAKEELNKAKLAGNTKRRTDILDLNQKEIDELKKTYGLSVLNIFKENGL
jgi:cupin superfamily acireductone dioxygenase involved in methionine salvage